MYEQGLRVTEERKWVRRSDLEVSNMLNSENPGCIKTTLCW